MHDNKTTVNHDKCGTPDCCGDCETAEDKQSAYAHIKRKLN